MAIAGVASKPITAERVDQLEAQVRELRGELRGAVSELLMALRGIGGSGVVTRSPIAAGIASEMEQI